MDATTAQTRDKRMTTALNDPVEMKLQTTNALNAQTLRSGTTLTRPLTDVTDVRWTAYGHSNLRRDGLYKANAGRKTAPRTRPMQIGTRTDLAFL